MNIFATDMDPTIAAKNMFNKHIVKMMLESVQLLCSPFPVGVAPYKRSHYNHPCSLWVRASKANYEWLLQHAEAISVEYTRRYGKVHLSSTHLPWLTTQYEHLNLPDIGPTQFAQAMPDYCRSDDPIDAYRSYYVNEKRYIAVWFDNTPKWYESGLRALYGAPENPGSNRYTLFTGNTIKINYLDLSL